MSRGTPTVLLASASPRRAELLAQIGVQFKTGAVDIDESRVPGETPRDMVGRLARNKAQAAIQGYGAQLPALGADTIVVCRGQIYGKPEDRAHGLTMLSALSGTTHSVYSAVCVDDGSRSRCLLSETRVTFAELTENDQTAYWETGEPCDKAGAYAIQGRAGIFVKKLEGSYSGVVGLPLFETAQLLDEFCVPYFLCSRDQVSVR